MWLGAPGTLAVKKKRRSFHLRRPPKERPPPKTGTAAPHFRGTAAHFAATSFLRPVTPGQPCPVPLRGLAIAIPHSRPTAHRETWPHASRGHQVLLRYVATWVARARKGAG